ncbi:MAG: hypothetical protein WCK17_14885, partial [Verrucomicrobiota bacterium]
RPLSAAHFAVLLNALGFPISRKWVEGAIRSKRDVRRIPKNKRASLEQNREDESRTTEEVVKFPPILRPAGRAAQWTAEELAEILKKAGCPPDLEEIKAAYEKIIERERVLSAERQRQKRTAAKTLANA